MENIAELRELGLFPLIATCTHAKTPTMLAGINLDERRALAAYMGGVSRPASSSRPQRGWGILCQNDSTCPQGLWDALDTAFHTAPLVDSDIVLDNKTLLWLFISIVSIVKRYSGYLFQCRV